VSGSASAAAASNAAPAATDRVKPARRASGEVNLSMHVSYMESTKSVFLASTRP
jgi:hypothetical protein